MLMKGVAANKTDEDEPEEEPEVRRSSSLAEKSPASFENLLLPPETPLPFGQESSLGETPETPGYQPYAIHRVQAQCKEEDDSLKKLNDFLASRDCSPVRYRVRGMLSEAAERTKREHLRKLRQGIVAVVETIAPGQEDETWAELTRSGILDAQFNAGKKGRMHRNGPLNTCTSRCIPPIRGKSYQNADFVNCCRYIPTTESPRFTT